MTSTAASDMQNILERGFVGAVDATAEPYQQESSRHYIEYSVLSPEKASRSCEESQTTAEDTSAIELSLSAPKIVPRKIASLPTAPHSMNHKLIQLWEGRVEEIKEDCFAAILTDKTNHNLPDESAEFGFDELNITDRALVRIGSLFIWSISYEDGYGGRRTVSEIRFRRLRPWTKQSLKRVKNDQEEIARILG